MILWGRGLFLVATVGCIFAPDVRVFLAMRILQASVVVAMVLRPGSGVFALLWIMLGTALPAVGAILLVIRRERRLPRL